MGSLREYLIKKLGGYATLEDALQDTDKHEVLTLAVQDLYNAVGPEDIFRRINGERTFEGKALPNAIAQQLIAEAYNFSKGRLWEVLKAELRWAANKKMFFESRTDGDLMAGKVMLYILKIIDDKLKQMVQETPKLKSEGDALEG